MGNKRNLAYKVLILEVEVADLQEGLRRANKRIAELEARGPVFVPWPSPDTTGTWPPEPYYTITCNVSHGNTP